MPPHVPVFTTPGVTYPVFTTRVVNNRQETRRRASADPLTLARWHARSGHRRELLPEQRVHEVLALDAFQRHRARLAELQVAARRCDLADERGHEDLFSVRRVPYPRR